MKLKVDRVIKNWRYADQVILDNFNFIVNETGIKGRKYATQKENYFLREVAFNEFGITKFRKEKRLGDLVLWHYSAGAHAPIHKDVIEPDKYHIRCNVMMRKPKIGGNVIIDNEEIELEKNDLWIVIANLEEHGSTPIEDGDRIIFSMGCVIDKEEIKKLI